MYSHPTSYEKQLGGVNLYKPSISCKMKPTLSTPERVPLWLAILIDDHKITKVGHVGMMCALCFKPIRTLFSDANSQHSPNLTDIRYKVWFKDTVNA